MEFYGVTGVAAITLICYLAAELTKALGLDARWLPSICGLLGGALGAAARFLMPDFPAEDLLSAIAVGIASGLAATGANQMYKQLVCREEDR